MMKGSMSTDLGIITINPEVMQNMQAQWQLSALA